MNTSSACGSCLRALRQSAKKDVRVRAYAKGCWLATPKSNTFYAQSIQPALSSRIQSLARPFSNTAAQRLRIEDVTEQSPTASSPRDGDASTIQKFAQRLRAQKQLAAATEPYVAYGATEDLFRECARAGAYTIPTLEEGSPPARTPTGEDLGVGSGWWYEGMHETHHPGQLCGIGSGLIHNSQSLV